ncbi:hypothetical protein CERSUDRAFT_76593 [Gelatoporia subvermispora B]|uniref:Uncharacterized protein n=1 Tax=Ceriporiopsis subvermispora (strain B) TaxID=914234 RepID=M2QMF7_CERS8|nr:hypothetical protein CERSUDRAFT_76593 [Gelatoporia subvermispora B]
MAAPSFIVPGSVEYLPCGRKRFQAWKPHGRRDLRAVQPGSATVPDDDVARFNKWVAHTPRELHLRGAQFWRPLADIPMGPSPNILPIPRYSRNEDTRLLPLLLESLWLRVVRSPTFQAAHRVVVQFLDDPEPILPTIPTPDTDAESSDETTPTDGTTPIDGMTSTDGMATFEETIDDKATAIDEVPALDDATSIDATAYVDGMAMFDSSAPTKGLFIIDEALEPDWTTSIDPPAAPMTDGTLAQDMTPTIGEFPAADGTIPSKRRLMDWDDTLAWMEYGDLRTMLRGGTGESFTTLEEMLKAAEVPHKPLVPLIVITAAEEETQAQVAEAEVEVAEIWQEVDVAEVEETDVGAQVMSEVVDAIDKAGGGMIMESVLWPTQIVPLVLRLSRWWPVAYAIPIATPLIRRAAALIGH